MDQALKDLAGNQLLSPDFSKELNKINRKYTLPLIPENKVTTSVSIPNPLGIVDYFKNSVNELKSRYFLDNGQVSEAGKKAIKEYVIAFITTPGINEFFIKYAATRFTGKFINSIGKHLPIQSVLLKETGVVSPLFSNKSSNPLTSLTNNIRDSIDSVFDFLDIEDSQTTAEYSSPSINHATESRFVKLAETSIILLDQ